MPSFSSAIKSAKAAARDLVDWITPFQRPRSLGIYKKLFSGKIGLEIGGPSHLWRKTFPIYRWAKRLDNYDFSDYAIRHNKGVGRGRFRYFLHKSGDQYCGENELQRLKEESYDFIVLRDVLEHTSNPLKMLETICNLTKIGGTVVVVTPNKLGTFDYARKYTTFKHIIEDFINDTQEDDGTHFQELKDLTHDHDRPQYSTREELYSIIDKNYKTREAHHHVFSLEVLARCCSEAGFKVIYASEEIFPHTLVIGVKYRRENLLHKPSLEKIMEYEQ